MADYPDLTIWTDAYLADTSDLTPEAHGFYLLLLFAAWRRPDCALPPTPDDIKRLIASTARFHGRTFNAVVPDILARFWTQGADGKWRQKRLLREREARHSRTSIASENASKRWRNSAETRAKGANQVSHTLSKPQPNTAETMHSADATAQRQHSDGNASIPTQPLRKEDSLVGDDGTRREEEPILTAEQKAAIALKLGADPDSIGLIANGNASTNGRAIFEAPTSLPPDQRLARFHQWLAPLVAGSWLTIAAAMDTASPDHKMALNACKIAARNNGKGWPIQAPQ